MSGGALTQFEVLVVDDEPGDVELTRMALMDGRHSCQVSVAVNGNDALSRLRKLPPYASSPTPDLVLLDLNMPQKSGSEVLQEMKSDPALSTIPVVVLTTSDVERDVVSCYELGASGYVTKPIDVDALFAEIRGIKEYWFGVVRRPG